MSKLYTVRPDGAVFILTPTLQKRGWDIVDEKTAKELIAKAAKRRLDEKEAERRKALVQGHKESWDKEPDPEPVKSEIPDSGVEPDDIPETPKVVRLVPDLTPEEMPEPLPEPEPEPVDEDPEPVDEEDPDPERLAPELKRELMLMSKKELFDLAQTKHAVVVGHAAKKSDVADTIILKMHQAGEL